MGTGGSPSSALSALVFTPIAIGVWLMIEPDAHPALVKSTSELLGLGYGESGAQPFQWGKWLLLLGATGTGFLGLALQTLGYQLEEAARAYEAQMRDLPRDVLPLDEVNGLPVFDLILLGMGADGHVGSVYPGSAAVTEAAELSEGVLAVEMPEKRSVTMSLRLINTAERVVVAASGAEKAETVRKALEDDECELPGALVDAFSTVWFLDLAAAGELEAYQEVGEDDDE